MLFDETETAGTVGMYYEKTAPKPEDLALAEAYADFAAPKLGILTPAIRFVREAAARSRDNNLFYTPAPAVGFVRDDKVFVRAGLTPARLVRVVVHECEHVRQTKLARQTLKVSHSLECDERAARLVEWEICGDLSSQASYDGCMRYLGTLKQKQSEQLREKMQPLLERATQRVLAMQGVKRAVRGLEYR